MDSDQSKPEVWRPKPRDDKRKIIPEEKPESTVFSAELLALKRIMDAKLKCQYYADHRLELGVWMVNTARKLYNGGVPSKWEECKTCNL